MQYGSLPKLKLNFDFKCLWEFIEIYLVGQREVEILASSKKIPILSFSHAKLFVVCLARE